MNGFFKLAILGALALYPLQAIAQTILGPAEVVDGDTLVMTGERIRLFGIDAPEAAQTCDRGGQPWACGQDATRQLKQLLSGKPVQCEGRNRDAYGRLVAVCFVGEIDIGYAMVNGGLAVALPDADGAYHEIQERVRQAKFGLWGATFDMPADWRAAHPRETTKPSGTSAASSGLRPRERAYRNQFGCAVKGNHSRRGEWIYHLPGMPYYEETRPEGLFCTESEAQAAGYRRSKAG